jgi:hypothetical protein
MMDWKDIAGKIGEWAPAIGAALAPVTGGTSLLIGGAVGALTKSLGLSPDAKPEDVLNALNTDPEARLKARIAENDFRLKQRDQDIEELRTRLSDVQSARTRQTEHERITGRADKNLYILAWWCIIAPIIVIGSMIYYGLPNMSPEAALMVGGFIGIIVSEYKTVTQYFFGSSKGSADKSAELAALRNERGAV